MKLIPCPVCERGVTAIFKWRGLYICEPCWRKYEKIEKLIKHGQLLEGPKLKTVLEFFGEKEKEEIKKKPKVRRKQI